MAGEKLGLGGHLTLDHQQFVNGMNRARDATGRFIKTADRGTVSQQQFTDKNGKVRDSMGRFIPGATKATAALNSLTMAFAKSAATVKAGAATMASGFRSITAGAGQAAMGLAPLSIAMGAGFVKAAKFEKQMSAVGAITRATEDDLSALRQEAQKQGVKSVFSATESAQAMEFLARAGAETHDIISGLGGVMAAAAADGIGLAEASDTVSQIVKGMGMEFSQAGHVADVLALTSAKANTNILALGESFTYGVSQAKSMGISVEETAAVFGKLADAGLKGSLGGTAFTNMLIKLSKPTKEGRGLLKKWGIELNKKDGSLRKIGDIVGDVQKKIGGLGTATAKAEAASHIFGIRGARAYNALATSGVKALKTLEKELIASSFGIGAAQEMADKRLDNFLGAFKLFASSVEAVSIEFFGPLLGSFKEGTQDLTDNLNDVLFAVQGLRNMQNAAAVASVTFSKKTAKAYAEQFNFANKMDEKAAALAETSIQALQTQAIGEEKLTRAQRKARAKGFADFVEYGLLKAKVSDKNRVAEMKNFQKIADAGLAAGASQKDQLALRNRMIQAITDQTKGMKKAGAKAKGDHDARMAMFFERQVARAKEQTAARAFLERQKKMIEIEEKHGKAARLMAEGFLEAIDTIKASIKDGINWIKQLGARFEGAVGQERLKQITKMVAIGGLLAAAFTPVILGLGMVSMVLKGLYGQFAGMAKVVWGFAKVVWGVGGIILKAFTFGPVLVALGALTGAFLLFRNEGETVGQTFTRLWDMIKTGALTAYNEAVVPFVNGFLSTFLPLITTLETTWDQVWTTVGETVESTKQTLLTIFGELFGEIFGGVDTSKNAFLELGQTVGNAVGALAQAVIVVVGGLVEGVAGVIKFLAPVLVTPFRTLWTTGKNIFAAVVELMRGNFMGSIKKLAIAIGDVLTLPFRMMITAILQAVKALPTGLVEKVVGKGTLAKLETFAKHGFGGAPEAKKPEKAPMAKAIKQPKPELAKAPMAKAIKQPKPEPETKVAQYLKPIVAAPVESATTKGLAKVINLEDRRPAMADRNKAILAAVEKLGPKASKEKIREALTDQKIEGSKANVQRAKAILQQRGAMQREDRLALKKAGEQKTVNANVNIDDKRTIDIKNQMCVDGQGLSVASARHKQSIYERSGGKTKPWNRRMAIESGVA
jgi:TP901 family phage tail tape measure protein